MAEEEKEEDREDEGEDEDGEGEAKVWQAGCWWKEWWKVDVDDEESTTSPVSMLNKSGLQSLDDNDGSKLKEPLLEDKKEERGRAAEEEEAEEEEEEAEEEWKSGSATKEGLRHPTPGP